MIVSYRLLKELLSFPYTPSELAEKLTYLGLEVEHIENISKKFEGVITAKVLDVAPISGTKLFNVKVYTGSETFNVVTAATNVKPTQIVPFAMVNAKLANGVVIQKKEFGDVVSEGMLCSYTELGLDDFELSNEEKNGILILPSDTEIGKKFEEVFPIEDSFLELSLLPDRADAFNVLGVARWIEIILARDEGRKADFRKLSVDFSLPEDLPQTPFNVEILDREHCTFYSGRLIEGVTVKNSSYKLRRELFKLRIRPINNIVDITNYIAKMYGQPLHAFDFDKLSGHIIVRLAKDGEKIKTLDSVERELTNKNLVIADERGPVAIAGVMGGEETAVTEQTVNIFLESAYFNPRTISRSSRSLGLLTDASMLFEKGVDPDFVGNASSIATKLILEEANGKPYKDSVVDFRVGKPEVSLRLSRASKLLGEEITSVEVRKYFDMEGLEYREVGDVFLVKPPSFRQDLSIEEDLIEEIVRMRGYNEFSEMPIVGPLKSGVIESELRFNDLIREFMIDSGLNEVLTSTLTNKEALSKFGLFDNTRVIQILNPLTEDMSYLRPNLFVTMLDVANRNFNFDINDLALFEVGKVFFKDQENFKEEYHLSIFLSGQRVSKNPYKLSIPYDYFYLKGIIEELFNYLKIDASFVRFSLPFMHPYQTAKVSIEDEFIGYLGKIHPDIFENAFFAELNISKLFGHANLDNHFTPFSMFPPVKRDIAVVVDRNIEESEVRKAILSTNIKELKNVVLFDVYMGPPLPNDKKNLAYSLEFVSLDRTLTSKEVDEFIKIIEENLLMRVNGVIRKNE